MPINIRNNIITDCKVGVQASSTADVELTGNRFHNISGTAIQILDPDAKKIFKELPDEKKSVVMEAVKELAGAAANTVTAAALQALLQKLGL